MTKQTKQSIWKPVSELPAGGKYDVVVKTRNSYYLGIVDGNNKTTKQCNLVEIDGSQADKNYIESVCTLADFINQQQSLEERITALETKLENK